MVVLAASIVTKSGKALVSRQYAEVTRIRIEGLLAAFPKLVGNGKQHTYVETENVRYVYQPMEGLYLLLVTNKASNILEDLDCLRLLSKVVPEYTHSLEEDAICRSAFELLFAFDEVISHGYKENVTVVQVKQNTEMESHEEKLHKMIIQSKINDTKDVMKRKAMEIDKSRIEARLQGAGSKSMPGYAPSMSSMGSTGMANNGDMGPTYSRPEPAFAKPAARAPAKKGMVLGKAKKTNDFLDSLAKEGELVEAEPVAYPTNATAAAAAAMITSDPVSIGIEEKLQVILNKDGGMESMEVQGTMSLQVLSEDDACLRVAITSGDNKGYQFKTHPNIDKALYSSESILGLKDPTRPFPTGSALGILKWRFQTADEALVPLSINCWPSVSGGESYINIEYESTAAFDLHNVVIAIPVSQAPKVNQVDGEWRFDPRKGLLMWTIELIDDSNRSGSMEFVVPAADSDSFFPVEVFFTSPKTLCDIVITAITSTESGAPVKAAQRTQLVTDGYQVV